MQKCASVLFANAVVTKIASALFILSNFVTLKLRLRPRYVLTRHNNVRLRYVTIVLLFFSVSLSGLSLLSQNSNAYYTVASNQYDPAHIPALIEIRPDDRIDLVSLVPDEPVFPLDREIEIQPGDALGVVMEKEGVGGAEAHEIIKAMKAHYDPRHIKAGQKIALHFDEDESNKHLFREMKMDLNPIKTLVVARAGEGFKAKIDEKEVEKVIRAKEATVEVSLYGSAAKAGIPQGIIAEAIRIYSWNVDFQRDIRSNDKLEIMYESYETKSGHVAKNGNILYAQLKLGEREIPLYRYAMSDGRIDYFQPDGRSIKRTLMKTPINGARMSSGFGKRHHPVLGYTKMHKGVDFAAPTGTPIFAAGDGVIERAGWFSGYGKYVRIRHNSKLKTAYAHMSKINSKLKSGTRVTQGQVIGYVGTTGRSTGPHLHYEVLQAGVQVNPRSVDLPVGEELVGKDKDNFKLIVSKMKQQYAAVLNGVRVAQAGSEKDGWFFN